MKKLSSSKLVLAMLFAVISISANAQLKMSSNGYLTFGPTSTYNDGTKDYNITLRGNIWLAGPNVGHFLQIDTNPAATRIASHYDQIIFYNTGTNTYNSIQVKNVYNYSDLAAKKNIQPLGRSIIVYLNCYNSNLLSMIFKTVQIAVLLKSVAMGKKLD